MKRKASAVWNGDLRNGNGSISSDSGVLSDAQFSFRTRFKDEKGTNPEELIAAAHAGCFSMALSNELASAGMSPESVATTATVELGQVDGAPTVTAVHLETKARVPGADRDAFDKAADAAKKGCPISKLLNAEITLDAELQN